RPTDQAALDENMGDWFRVEVPDVVELCLMAMIFRKELEERIDSRHLVVGHLDKVRGCMQQFVKGKMMWRKRITKDACGTFFAVEAACALEVDAMGALDLVEAVGALDLVKWKQQAVDIVGLSLNILIST
nr:hypothetical protein [Tanacetum cinerariifolium]